MIRSPTVDFSDFMDYIDMKDQSLGPQVAARFTNRDRLLYTMDVAADSFPEEARKNACNSRGGGSEGAHVTRREVLEQQLRACMIDSTSNNGQLSGDFYDCLDQLRDDEVGQLFSGTVKNNALTKKMTALALLRNPNRPTTLEEIEEWDRQCAQDGLCLSL